MSGTDESLSGIRAEIDAIDDGIVDLLLRRAATQARVRAQKAAAGTLAQSPIRPAREAEILRRLLDRAGGGVDAQFLVRLWRLILTQSALSQAPMCLHAEQACLSDAQLREHVAIHFGALPRIEHGSEAEAVAAVASNKGELCVVRSEGGWAEAFLDGRMGEAVVIGLLPAIAEGAVPPMLVIGHAASEPSGEDCTVVIGMSGIHPEAQWSCRSGRAMVSCLPGFRDLADRALKGFIVAGRLPAQIRT